MEDGSIYIQKYNPDLYSPAKGAASFAKHFNLLFIVGSMKTDTAAIVPLLVIIDEAT